jgi:hypothetical protein
VSGRPQSVMRPRGLPLTAANRSGITDMLRVMQDVERAPRPYSRPPTDEYEMTGDNKWTRLSG